jgi:hypothetical protein
MEYNRDYANGFKNGYSDFNLYGKMSECALSATNPEYRKGYIAGFWYAKHGGEVDSYV